MQESVAGNASSAVSSQNLLGKQPERTYCCRHFHFSQQTARHILKSIGQVNLSGIQMRGLDFGHEDLMLLDLLIK